ncbi:Substrate-specific component RibU of riboflavin ECF transporter [Lactococcus cremoris]|uniref:Riboflavin transporter n=1 Tax=Lactococcus lactis subsp. cremoris TaxID=1359 RepID=A0A161W588_LACLC|nr:ECF transporter S component [Lactococcus cremoris]KZK08610.1 Substrate-specific component RibU of riboflavin ECF transporter [Lactococcus cremoris]
MSKTRRMVLIAMLAALSTILLLPILQFPLLPGIDFMKVELSIIPVLIGVFTLGLGDGFIILFIRSVLWYLLFNQGPSTWIGVPMNFVALGIFMAIVWFFTKKKFSIKNYTVGIVLATIASVLVMMVLNVFYALPLYRLAAGFDVDKIFAGATHLFNMGSLSVTLNPTYLLTVVLPFNALQYIIFALVFGLIVAVFKKNKVVKFYNA